MKIFQFCAMALLLVLSSATAFANGINDPGVIVHGAGNKLSADGECTGTCVGLTFSFTSPKGGSGTEFFTNNSGKNWSSLSLIELAGQKNFVPANEISCTSETFFTSCSVSTLKNGSVDIFLSGIKSGLNPHQGILAGEAFALTFQGSDGGWPKGGVNFAGKGGTGAPEPGTIALMITGLSALVPRRKQLLKRLQA